MATRHLYLARHGEADPFGQLTDVGYQQSRLLGRRLAALPVDVVWHSPLPRAEACAREVARHLPGVPVIEVHELIDHVPYVPGPDRAPPAWAGFFDGYDDAEAAEGRRIADALVHRFGSVSRSASGPRSATHEVLVTHSYPIAWLVRHAMAAPPEQWLGLNSANAALTVVEHREGSPSSVVMFNEMSHLPAELRWTGFPDAVRP